MSNRTGWRPDRDRVSRTGSRARGRGRWAAYPPGAPRAVGCLPTGLSRAASTELTAAKHRASAPRGSGRLAGEALYTTPPRTVGEQSAVYSRVGFAIMCCSYLVENTQVTRDATHNPGRGRGSAGRARPEDRRTHWPRPFPTITLAYSRPASLIAIVLAWVGRATRGPPGVSAVSPRCASSPWRGGRPGRGRGARLPHDGEAESTAWDIGTSALGKGRGTTVHTHRPRDRPTSAVEDRVRPPSASTGQGGLERAQRHRAAAEQAERTHQTW